MTNPVRILYQQTEHPEDPETGMPHDIGGCLFIEYENGEEIHVYADVPCRDKFVCVATPRRAIELALALQEKTRELLSDINRPEAVRYADNITVLRALLEATTPFDYAEKHVIWVCDHQDWSDADGKDNRVTLDSEVI